MPLQHVANRCWICVRNVHRQAWHTLWHTSIFQISLVRTLFYSLFSRPWLMLLWLNMALQWHCIQHWRQPLYSFNVATGHKLLSDPKDGKNKSTWGLLCLLCLDQWAGRKVTPSIEKERWLASSWERSADREDLVKVMSITSFSVSCCRVRLSFDPRSTEVS